jgi:RNA polymerase sigma-70 factor, ECF subfamily
MIRIAVRTVSSLQAYACGRAPPSPTFPQPTMPPSGTARSLDADTRSDADLVIAMRSGEESALAALYDRHSPVILGFLMRLMRERADAESVLLETFLQASRSADRFDPQRSNVLSWLMMIARTRALDVLRSAARQHALVPLSLDDVPAAQMDLLQAGTDPQRVVEQREQEAAIRQALVALPQQQREAIELAFFLGLTHLEIAERLGEPLGTIKSRIRGGLLKLREPLHSHREVLVQ